MEPEPKRPKLNGPLYSPFEIPFNPDHLRKPRKLRVVCIGAGFAGLTLAYKINIEKHLGHIIDFQIYERQHDVGGTWLVNKYPGLTCDVPIHIYTLPWAPKHDWTRFMASGSEIIQYIRGVNRKFELDRWIKFNAAVEEAVWDEESGKWKLQVITSHGERLMDECDILIGAAGTQNTPLKSAIPGLENFEGPILHTGAWDESADCHNKRIAVIGNGSSGIQAFGALQQQAKQITHYIRSATWISLNYMSQFTRNADGRNFEYTDDEKAAFQDPENLYAYRRKLESTSNGIFKNLVFDETAPEVKRGFRATMEKVMKERLNENPELINKLMPNYQPWCRRLTPGDGYLEALQQPNARLVDDPIAEIKSSGIRTQSGEETDYDMIVAATGFVNTRVPPWKMVGRNGVSLADRFKEDADGYMSVAAPSMPNYFSIGCGPNFTIANGPLLSAFGFIADYILNWASKIAEEDIHSVCVKDDVAEAFNIYIQQVLRRTAWNRECESWYKKARKDEYRTGISAIYPGSMMHFKSMLENVRPEDFDVKYRSANPFKFYGCGLTELDLSSDQPDLSYYLADTMRLDSIM